MRPIAGFVRRERLYLLLAVFVILLNVAVFLPYARHVKAKAGRSAVSAMVVDETKRRAAEAAIVTREELSALFQADRSLAMTVNLAAMLILAVLCFGVAADLAFILKRSDGREMFLRTYDPPCPVRWGLWDVAKVIVLFLFFGYILVLIESLIVGLVPMLRNGGFRMIVNTAILDTIAVICIVHFALAHHGETLTALGLSAKNFARNVLYGVFAYVAMAPVLALIAAATAVIASFFRYVPEQQAVVRLFMREEGGHLLVMASIFAAVAGPIVEEIFFRSFLYNALRNRAGRLSSMLITALAFAALHAHPAGFLPIMAIGVALSYLYEKTGTLVAPITMHIIHNVGMMGLVYVFRQLHP